MNIYNKYFKKYKIPFLSGILCVGLETVCDLLGPTLMSHIIDKGIRNSSPELIWHYGGLMLLITLIGAVFAVTRNILASVVSQRFGNDLRQELFLKIIKFSEASTDKIESGSLITRMTNDTGQLTMFVNDSMRIFFKALIMFVGSIVLACMLTFQLSYIMFGVVLIVSILILISLKLSYPLFGKLQKAMDRINSVVQEYLIGVRLVKAFGTYDKEVERFDEANTKLMQSGVNTMMVTTLFFPLMWLAVGLASAFVIYAGSKLFLLEIIEPGKIIAITMYMSLILMSLLVMANVFNALVRAKISGERIEEVLLSDDDFTSGGLKKKLKGDICFKNVTFSYPSGSGNPAIKDLTFSVKNGEKIAVIGPTGSGKSTIVWLLLRFYDVNQGEICFDNYNIKELDINSVRSNVAIVPQQATLFSGTVKDNLRWGNRYSTDEDIKDAVSVAQANFIDEMAKGYDSMLGRRGVNISGGQKQRISIARGFLKKTPIFILDDATSALDAITEAKVRHELTKVADKYTLLTITQRVTTAMSFDRILVMEDGEKKGFGTHKELMQTCGIYRDIYSSQMENIEKEGR